jgi:hypothetical protein
LAPSFSNVRELTVMLDAPSQPIVKVDPSMVRHVQGSELKSLGEPQIIHSLQFVDQLDDAFHSNLTGTSFSEQRWVSEGLQPKLA